MKKIFWSAILTLCLCLTMFPVTEAQAAGAGTMTDPTTTFINGKALKQDGEVYDWHQTIWGPNGEKINGFFMGAAHTHTPSLNQAYVRLGREYSNSSSPLSGNESTMYLLHENGELSCFQLNTDTEILDYIDRGVVLTDVVQFHDGMALKKDGTAWEIFSRDSRYVTDNVKQVSADSVLKNDGSLWIWTRVGNDQYELIRIMDNVVFATDGMAIKTDGSLWSWGNNERGQVGNGTVSERQETPVKIMDNVIGAWSGADTRFALTEDGQLYGWGHNSYAQLGYSGGDQSIPAWKGSECSYILQTRPRKIGLSDVVSIYPNGNNTSALKRDGTLWYTGTSIGDYYAEHNEDHAICGFTKVMDGVMLPNNGLVKGTPANVGVTPSPAPVTPPTVPSRKTPFTDVSSGAYYEDAVRWALDNGVTTGTTATTFNPNATCTRGQVVTFLWRAQGSPEPKSLNNPFTDVSSGSYYYKAVLWALEQGITTGTTTSTFSPNNTCTNAQVVTFLWRANGYPSSGSSALANSYPGQYYTTAIAWADNNGLLTGTGTQFVPNNQSPRSAIVTYLYRNADGKPVEPVASSGGTETVDLGQMPDIVLPGGAEVTPLQSDIFEFIEKEGFLKGIGNGTFTADDYITLDVWMTVLARSMGLVSVDVHVPALSGSSHWASGYAKLLYDAGLLDDYSDAYLDGLQLRPTVYRQIFEAYGITTYPSSHYSITPDYDGPTTALLILELITPDKAALPGNTPLSAAEAFHLFYEITYRSVKEGLTEVPDSLAIKLMTVSPLDDAETPYAQMLSYMEKLPNNLLAGLIQNRYLYIIEDDIGYLMNLPAGLMLAGLNDYENKMVYLDAQLIPQAVIHETGHALSTISDGWNRQKALYQEERQSAYFLFDLTATQSSSEFMAEAIRYAIENRNDPAAMTRYQETAPKTYDYVVNELLKRDWGLTWETLFQHHADFYYFYKEQGAEQSGIDWLMSYE